MTTKLPLCESAVQGRVVITFIRWMSCDFLLFCTQGLVDVYFLPLNNGNGYIKVALEVKLHWQHLRHAIHRALHCLSTVVAMMRSHVTS